MFTYISNTILSGEGLAPLHGFGTAVFGTVKGRKKAKRDIFIDPERGCIR